MSSPIESESESSGRRAVPGKRNAFLTLAVIVLVATAFSKLLLVLGESKVLGQSDPLFAFLSNRQVLFGASMLELAVAWGVWHANVGAGLTGVAWLSSVFLCYRTMLVSIGYQGYCNCLGSLAGPLGIDDKVADRVALGIAVFLLVGSCIGLVWTRYPRSPQSHREPPR